MKQGSRISGQVAIALALVLAGGATARASLITTLDFDDAIWAKTFTASGTAVNASVVSGGSITAAKSAGSGGTRIEVSLTGAISTVGFQNISIGFTGTSSGDLEWEGTLSNPVNSSDGLYITGNGVTINARGINATEEAAFDGGGTFPAAGVASFQSSDFVFDPVVNNGAITSLTFVLQVNANAEQLVLSNVRIFGDPLGATVVPEPSTVLGVLAAMAVLGFRRKRRES